MQDMCVVDLGYQPRRFELQNSLHWEGFNLFGVCVGWFCGIETGWGTIFSRGPPAVVSWSVEMVISFMTHGTLASNGFNAQATIERFFLITRIFSFCFFLLVFGFCLPPSLLLDIPRLLCRSYILRFPSRLSLFSFPTSTLVQLVG